MEEKRLSESNKFEKSLKIMENVLQKTSSEEIDKIIQEVDKEEEVSVLELLTKLGFTESRTIRENYIEYTVEYTEDIVDTLKGLGYKETWGHEGSLTSFAKFKCDNPDHSDYGKMLISIIIDPFDPYSN